MKGKLILPALFCFVLLSGFAVAQETWNLEKCINYAFENSITLQQADLAIDNAALTKKQNQFSRLPNLNGSTSFGFNFGRSIDPTTNQFESQNIRSNTFNLSTNMPLYNGGQIMNSIKQSDLDMRAAEADKAATENTLALDVASAYLNVLFNQDQLSISQNRLKQTQDQLAQTNKLIQAGSLPEANRIDLEAQQAADEQGLILAENNVSLAYLSLKQLLNMDPNAPMEIDRPNLLAPEVNLVDSYSIENLYQKALGTQPNIEANELREQSAQTGVKIAKSALIPSLGFGASINTNYSSLGLDFASPIITNERIEQVPQPAILDNQETTIIFLEPEADVAFPDQKYFDQLDQNLSQNLGVTLTVPIFNRMSNRINIQRSELDVTRNQLLSEQARIQLKADIQRALTDAIASKKQLESSKITLNAREQAFKNAEKRYDLGSINSFEYNQAKDNLDVSRSNEAFSRYDFIFKLKVLDFYMGNPISLD